MARVLITRAQPQAGETAQRVGALGFTPVVLPLMQTLPMENGLADLRSGALPAGALMIATSGRAIEVLEAAGLGPWMSGQRFAVVGSHAAARLQALGAVLALPPVRDVQALIEAVEALNMGAPMGAPMVYLAAADRKPTLERHFPAMRTLPVYRAKALAGFSAAHRADLSMQPPGFALVYSRRSALLLARAIAGAGIGDALEEMRWLCLSDDVAAAAPAGTRVQTAAAPTQEALLALLG